MRKGFIICFLFVLFSLSSFSKSKIPAQLIGNWLSPKTNEWKFGFAEKYAVAYGEFWNYKVKNQKGNHFVLTLENGKARRELYVTVVNNEAVKIGNSKDAQLTYTNRYNELADYARYDTKGFQLPLVKRDTMHLKGVLRGYDRNLDGYQYINIIFRHFLNGKQVVLPVKLDTLGRFHIDFPLESPREITIQYADRITGFYAIPGHNLMIAINIDRKIKLSSMEDAFAYITSRPDLLFMGQDGLLNNEFNSFSYKLKRIAAQDVVEDNQRRLNQYDYNKYCLGKRQEMLDSLSAHCLRHHSGKLFSQYFEKFIEYLNANDLLRYGSENERKHLSKSYLSFLKELSYDDELSATTENYFEFLNQVSQGINKSWYKIKSPSIEEVVRRVKETGYVFTAGQEDMVKGSIFIANGPESLYMQVPDTVMDDQNLSDALLLGARRLVDEQKERINRDSIREFGIKAGSFTDNMLLAMALYDKISDNNGLETDQLNKLEVNLKLPQLRSLLTAYNNELKIKSSGSFSPSAHIIDPISNESDKLIETLTKKYRGKVLYIDFWAPWCGPCMSEMPQSAALKKEFQGKDVVFLYLGVNCSKDSWSKAIKINEISGEHYLLSKEEYALLSGRFQISGIPRYMLVNKTGKIVDEKAKLPSQKADLIREISLLLN